jgi:hypothetical protein|tara:strand:- start:46 stop:384 length:339 start_codon:yes stop_codon:yes gene_type:complete
MFKRCSILAVVSLFILAMVYTVTTAQEKKEKLVFVTGIVKEVDYENGTITIVRKKRDGGTIENTIMVTEQTKYFFVKGINELESGNGVITECRGVKGEYEAVKVKRISKGKK